MTKIYIKKEDEHDDGGHADTAPGYMARIERELVDLLTAVAAGAEARAAVQTIKRIIYDSYHAGRRTAATPKNRHPHDAPTSE